MRYSQGVEDDMMLSTEGNAFSIDDEQPAILIGVIILFTSFLAN